MNAKEILDHASNIIRRQDLDRGLLLFFINTARRAVLRDKPIKRFNGYKQNVATVNGVIDMNAHRIKNPRVVEWFKSEVDGTTTKVYLARMVSYRQAMELYGSLAAVGNPQGFLELGTTLQVMPVPTSGQINVYGEFWPVDLSDSAAASDVITMEIPEVLIYMGAAEYLDMLGEAEKAQYWRQKGMALAESYLTQLNRQDFDGYDAWKRVPFNWYSTVKSKHYGGFSLEDLDMGEWT